MTGITGVKVLQALNGAAAIPALACLILLAVYLIRESRRRGLRSLDWFRLPPSMSLVVAMFIFDAGVLLRVIATWVWYTTTNRGLAVDVLFGIAVVLMIVGLWCKVSALTKPDLGRGPWFAISMLTILAAGLLLFER